MSRSKSTSEDLQTSDPSKDSPPTYFSKENVAEPINSNIAKGSSHRPHESRSEANRKPKCTKCRKAINVPIGEKDNRKKCLGDNTTSCNKKPCHKCKKKSSSYRCPKKTSKKAFEVQASSRSIKQHASNAIIKCTTALKEKLSSKDRLDDYILLDGPIYIRKNCLDVNGGTCRGTCCSSGEEIEVKPEPVPEELTEEQRFQECRKCCFQMKCAEKKICDNDMDFIVAKYEQFYLSNQTESKYGIDKADSDLSGKPVTGLSKTHGETPGDYKYHFLMTDAACSAPPDGQDADDVVMTANSRPVSPKPHPAVRISNTSGEIPTFYYAQDTSTEAMPEQSLSVAADDEESTSSILIGKLDPDEQAEEEKEQEEEPAQGDVSEGKTDASENESDNKYDDEEYRRDSKVSWGGESSHRATMDTTYSDDDRDDKASHVRISEDPKRDPLGWSNQSVDRTTNKKSASFVKKSLVGSPLEMEQTPPPAPPPKKKFCSFFRRRNKSEKAEKTNKSRSQTFAKDPDSSESSEISFEESRRNSNRSRASE